MRVRTMMSRGLGLMLAAAAILFSGGEAFAQNLETTGPSLATDAFRQVDENGVDLINGTFNLEGPSLHYGDGQEAGAIGMRWNGRMWTTNTPSIWRDDDNGLFINTGRTVDEFELRNGLWVPTRGNSSTVTCIFFDEDRTQMRRCDYTGHDGTVAFFDAFNLGWPANSYAPELGNLNARSGVANYADGSASVVNATGLGQFYFGVGGSGGSLGNNSSGTGSWSTLVDLTLSISVSNGSQGVVREIGRLTIATPGLSYDNRKNRNIFRPRNATQSITDPNGQVWRYTFNTDQDMTGVRRPGSTTNNITLIYNDNHKVTSFTNASGTWTYSYSSNNGIGTTVRTAPDNSQVVVTYVKKKGNVRTYRDELNRTTSYTYDTSNRLGSITYPEGNSVHYGYDARGNVTTITRYPKPGSVLGETPIVARAEYPASCPAGGSCNLPSAMIDANNNRTEYTYYKTRVASVTRPAVNGVNPQTRYTYALLPRRLRAADGSYITQTGGMYALTQVSECRTLATCAGSADEARTTLDYGQDDPNSEVVWMPARITTAAGDGSASSTQTMTYNERGDVASLDGPMLANTDIGYYRYDAMHRVLGTILPDVDGSGPHQNRATRNTYSPDGLLIFEEIGTVDGPSDAAWAAFSPRQSTATVYDSAGRRTMAARAAAGVTEGVTQVGYDLRGRESCTALRMNRSTFPTVTATGAILGGAIPADACTAAAAGPDGNDRITKNFYDPSSRITAIWQGVDTPQAQAYVRHEYSPNGQRVAVTDANGNRAEMSYDGHDRQSRWYLPMAASPGAADYNNFEQYTYDDNGNRLTYRRRDGSLFSFEYDALNRMTAKIVPDRADLGVPLTATRDVHYAYDLLGDQLSARFDSPTGEGITAEYDALRRPISTTSNMGGVARTLTRAFEAHGVVNRLTYPDGQFLQYSAGPTGLVTGMTANGQMPLLSLIYDDFGRTIARNELTTPQSVTTQSYDSVGRLSGLSYNFPGSFHDQTFSFARNAASQIISRVSANDFYAYAGELAVNRAYTVNGLNQYLTAGPASFAYDGNGNLTGDGTFTYLYDVENRLIGKSGGVSLAYDPLGRLFSISSGTGTTQFLHDGDNMVVEYGETGIRERFGYLPGSSQPLLRFQSDSMSYPHYLYSDNRGSIIAISQMGNMSVHSYDNWGIPTAKNSGRFRFAGQMWLAELGMSYNRARLYSATLGRFLQVDPVGYEDQVNLYAYALNDPVNHVDPTGTRAVLTGTPADRAAFIAFVRQTTGIRLTQGAGGVLSATAPRNMGPGGTDMMGAIADSRTITFNAVQNSSAIHGDSFATNDFDVADFQAFRSASTILAGAQLGHVITERLHLQTEGIIDNAHYFPAHAAGMARENEIMGSLSRDDGLMTMDTYALPTPGSTMSFRYYYINPARTQTFPFLFGPDMQMQWTPR